MATTIFAKLGDSLLRAGAPLLREVVVQAVGGGIAGRIAGAAIDALAESLGVPGSSLEEKAESVVKKIDADPTGTATTVRRTEEEFVSSVQIGVESLKEYHALLMVDAKSEGLISRIWRPLFALVFTFCYAVVVITICWLLWTRQLATLTNLNDVTGFMTFAFIAGCAVLGIQVWKRTEEKKARIE